MPAHSERAGSIILEAAYAASKMLDSSAWNGLLRNRITPSDVDHPGVGLCFDNDGAIIFCDFSIACCDWDTVRRQLRGQRWLYESIIKNTAHCAVICKHSVSPKLGRPIDTLRDVEAFQVMLWCGAAILSPVYEGWRWKDFVRVWVNHSSGPKTVKRQIMIDRATDFAASGSIDKQW